MSEWQKIETAPSDGTMILAYNEHHGSMYVVEWQPPFPGEPDDEPHWGSGDALWFNANYFQYWMPLPEPPFTGSARDIVNRALKEVGEPPHL